MRATRPPRRALVLRRLRMDRDRAVAPAQRDGFLIECHRRRILRVQDRALCRFVARREAIEDKSHGSAGRTSDERLAWALRAEARAGRRLDALRRMPGHPLSQAGRAKPGRLPRVQPPFSPVRDGADRPAPGRGHVRGMVRRAAAARSARLQRPPALPRARPGRASTHGPGRGGRRRPGIHQGHPHRLRDHRQQLHHGEHGLGRRRETDPGDRGGDPAAACRW